MKNPLFAALALCLACACGDNPVGRACKTTDDCSPSFTCFTEVGGGFCSRGCTAEGDPTQCGGGTACAPVATNALVCSPVCTDSAECNVNLVCGTVLGFAQKVCRTRQ